MNKIKELLKTNNIVKYSLILTLTIVILLSTTLAYYSWGSTANTNIAFDVIADVIYIYYDAGADITGANLYPTDDKEDGIKKEITVRADRYSPSASYNLYLDLKTLPDELKDVSFKYALYGVSSSGDLYNIDANANTASGDTTVSGNFEENTGETCTTNNTTHIVLLSNVTPTVEEVKYMLYIWIDGVNYTNPDDMMNQSFEFTLHADGVNVTDPPLDTSGANAPNIVEGMIPIYYDESDGNWKKADQTNTNETYKWYDYTNKQWANVVLVTDSTRDTYMNASRGTTIDIDDVLAFYVWIPRYKYRVWNISRQNCGSTDIDTCEATYAYTAYSTGIEIEFETGTGSTGNVTCDYNVSNITNPTTLSDVCTYNGTEEITTTTDNTQFKDNKEAWYTHPAFTFGEGNEITGFWVGKFETTGTATAPTILPDTGALTNQKVAAQFTTSQLFGTSSTYGISDSGLTAHMLKNLEWGAVVYLSYSNYGMCNGTSCTGMYVNDSYNTTTRSTTGRSGGRIADGDYSDYGTYTYDGKIVGSDGTIGDYATDRTLGTNASTTGNIYGVYDMNGGSHEYVMANMYSIPTGTYVGPIGTSNSGFNGVNNSGDTLYSSGNSLLATVTSSSIALNTANLKYFDTYSYGASNSFAQTSWNRSRLGDATGEIVSGTLDNAAWKPEAGVNGSLSAFVYSSYDWFSRGAQFGSSNAGPFYFYWTNGKAFANYSFRSTLS